MKRTRAIEILEAQGLPYELREFKAAEYTAEEVAEKLKIPLASVFKTLVVEGEKSGAAMAVIPGDRELNLKKMAAALKDKKAALIKLGDLQRLTGYVKGGCSPLGSKQPLPVYIDLLALEQDLICVSAGLRGLQILIAPDVLAKACKAEFFNLV